MERLHLPDLGLEEGLHQPFEIAERYTEDLAIQENQGAERLRLGRGAHVAVGGEVGEAGSASLCFFGEFRASFKTPVPSLLANLPEILADTKKPRTGTDPVRG